MPLIMLASIILPSASTINPTNTTADQITIGPALNKQIIKSSNILFSQNGAAPALTTYFNVFSALVLSGPIAEFGGRVRAQAAVNSDEVIIKSQLDGILKAGSTTFPTDGVVAVFNIPHGLGVMPSSFAITFANTTDPNVLSCVRSKDATNITLNYTTTTPPTTGSMTIDWQVFK